MRMRLPSPFGLKRPRKPFAFVSPAHPTLLNKHPPLKQVKEERSMGTGHCSWGGDILKVGGMDIL